MATAKERKKRPKQRANTQRIIVRRTNVIGLSMSNSDSGWLVTVGLAYHDGDEGELTLTSACPVVPRFKSRRAAAQAMVGLAVAYETDGRDIAYFIALESGATAKRITFTKVSNMAGF